MVVGDCYVAAATAVVESEGLTLVHGIPTGVGGNAKGLRYGHAWIEVGGLVIEVANGSRTAVPREAYYAAGRIRPEECVRYDRREAAEMMKRHGHYGPWDDRFMAVA